MGQRFHRGFTAAERTESRDRWKRGELLKAIGRAFGKPSSSIYFLVAACGFRPADGRRSRLALRLAEREVISRGITAHRSARSIAKLLGRSPSTVSREISRNGGYSRYRATLADAMPGRDLFVKTLSIGEPSAAETGCGGEAQIGLVTRADSRLVKRKILTTSIVKCHTRRSTAAYLYKHVACSKKNCLDIFDQDVRCVVPGRLIRMAIDWGI